MLPVQYLSEQKEVKLQSGRRKPLLLENQFGLLLQVRHLIQSILKE